MSEHQNHLGQPIGFPLPGWTARPRPPRTPLAGRFCRVEPIDVARHADDLHAAYSLDREGRLWTYLPYGPFATADAYRTFVGETYLKDDPLFHAIVDTVSGRAVGVASLMRIDPAPGVIEVGGIAYSPLLQRTPAATEAMFLLMRRVFDELGYRRYEWKCDLLNAPSRAAAQRYGFRFEGIFRQATVYKGRSRETAWYAAIDAEWPILRQAFENWLAEDNFDEHGKQRTSLAHWTGTVLKRRS